MAVISFSYKQFYEVIAICVFFLLLKTILPDLDYYYVMDSFIILYVAGVATVQGYMTRLKKTVNEKLTNFKKYHVDKWEDHANSDEKNDIVNQIGLSLILSLVLFVVTISFIGSPVTYVTISGAGCSILYALLSVLNMKEYWKKVWESDLVKYADLTKERVDQMVVNYFNIVSYGKEIMEDLDEMEIEYEKFDFEQSNQIASNLLAAGDLNEVKELTLELQKSSKKMVEVLEGLEELYNQSIDAFNAKLDEQEKNDDNGEHSDQVPDRVGPAPKSLASPT